MTSESFVSLASDAMAGLAIDFQLSLTVARADESEAVASFENATTAILVRHDAYERRVFVSLHKKRGIGASASPDINDRLRDPLNGFDVDDLIALRCPDRAVVQQNADLTSVTQLREVLTKYSGVLAEGARDVLAGNFEVFAQLADVVHDRIKRLEREGSTIGPDARAFLRAYSSERKTLDV